MKVIVGQRRTGKTTKLVKMMMSHPEMVMVCSDEMRVRDLQHRYPDIEHRRFISSRQYKDGALRGTPQALVVVDDLDEYIYQAMGLSHHPIVAVALTGDLED